MNDTWIEDFLTLARVRNFSRAAEIRNVTQPAFSRRIRSLESWLGAPLFLRGTNGIQLSDAGKYFEGVAEGLSVQLIKMRKEINRLSSGSVKDISIAATHSISTTFFPTWINFAAGSAERINLISDTYVKCEELFQTGKVNLLMCYCPTSHMNLPTGSQYESIAIESDLLVPCSAPNEDGSPRWPLAPATPARHLGYNTESGLARILAHDWQSKQHRFVLDTIFTSHLAIVLMSLVRNGLGFAWLPSSIATSELEKGTIMDAGSRSFAVPLEIRLFRACELTPAENAFWNSCAITHSSTFG